MAPRKRPAEERFWEKVDKTGECWLWTGAKSRNGYGVFAPGNGSTTSAQRFAWELANGPIPKGIWVLHKCDVPVCVRADHLFLGTPGDNTKDMYAKGRQPVTHSERAAGTAAKFLLRLPPELHEHLKAKAAEQGISLNQWIVTLLAGASEFRAVAR